MIEKSFTQHDLDIALLKQRSDDFSHILKEIKSEIKSQFHLVVGLLLGVYGMITAAGLAKILGVI
jgi:hypothetical protein